MRTLLAAATTLNGLLAGANADRLFIQLPAFRKTGPRAWAEFSRHADLAPSGMMFYPTLAIGGTLLSIAASVAAPASGAGRRPGAAAATRFAAVLATAGLLLTIKAAPNMLQVRHLGDDVEGLHQRFDGFEFWSRLRGALQIGAFVANLWALTRS